MSLAPEHRIIRLFETIVPFVRFLGMRFLSLESGTAVMEIPFREELVGNPELPALHGGVVSSLLDTCGGAAVWSLLGRNDRVSTVDLRVDYLRPARTETLRARAAVVRLGNRVGVVELRAYHPDDEERPVAVGTGVYNVRRMAAADGAALWAKVEESPAPTTGGGVVK